MPQSRYLLVGSCTVTIDSTVEETKLRRRV
jgi:hypothetical protein